jgi:hypothetical protein
LVFGGTALLTGPYWLPVLNHHGLSPFIYALHAGESSLLPILSQFAIFRYTEEFFMHLGQILALIGLFATLVSKDFMFVAWLLVVTVLNPGSANRSLFVPVCLLIGICIDTIILPSLKNLWRNNPSPVANDVAGNRSRFRNMGKYLSPQVVVMLLFAQLFTSSYLDQYMNPLLPNSLSQNDRAAMRWIAENTSKDGVFIVIPASQMWQSDPISEWFPALTKRTNYFTVQGYEWTNQFNDRRVKYSSIVHAPECSVDWGQFSQTDNTYVYYSTSTNYLFPCMTEYEDQLRRLPSVYQNDQVTIYSLRSTAEND